MSAVASIVAVWLWAWRLVLIRSISSVLVLTDKSNAVISACLLKFLFSTFTGLSVFLKNFDVLILFSWVSIFGFPFP